MKKYIIMALAALAVLASCKSQYEKLLESTNPDDKYNAAFEFFNKGKYGRAAELFESLSIAVSGQEREDTVLYYWGLSNYRNRDYYTAETNFTSFLESFPRSPFSEEASFLRVDCLYRSTYRWELDQMPTYKAISAMGEFISEHPDSPHVAVCRRMIEDLGVRLDRKAYEDAKLYYHLEDYKAARVALKNVLKDDADNIYREDILYYTAMASYNFAHLSVAEKQKERYLTFIDDYFNFIGEYPESKHRNQVDGLYKKARKFLGMTDSEKNLAPAEE